MKTLSLLLVTLSVGSMIRAESPPEALSWQNYREVKSMILPSEQEESWKTIGWHSSLETAFIEAAESRKPVLIWAMNGDPLGCT